MTDTFITVMFGLMFSSMLGLVFLYLLLARKVQAVYDEIEALHVRIDHLKENRRRTHGVG